MPWTTPKIDFDEDDGFLFSDINKTNDNIKYLNDELIDSADTENVSIKVSGSVSADGPNINNILPFSSLLITASSPKNILTEYGSLAISLGTEATPPAGLVNANQYLEIPYSKRGQHFILLRAGSGHQFNFVLYKYDRITTAYTLFSTKSVPFDGPRIDSFDEIWSAMQNLTANEDLRIFYDCSTAAGIVNLTLQGFR